jgi:hypothetical protein
LSKKQYEEERTSKASCPAGCGFPHAQEGRYSLFLLALLWGNKEGPQKTTKQVLTEIYGWLPFWFTLPFFFTLENTFNKKTPAMVIEMLDVFL